MKAWGRWACVLALPGVALVCLATRLYGVQFRSPHMILPEPGQISPSKLKELEDALAREEPADREHALWFALGFTGHSLYFGLAHVTSFVFPVHTAREGNCVEYTYLFVTAFDAAARRAGLTARAHRVRSLDARVWGFKLPGRAFADHDWALVEDPADGWRRYVDPTLGDARLGESLATNVRGAVPSGASGEKAARTGREDL